MRPAVCVGSEVFKVAAIRNFFRDERGVETVQFVVWVPFICFLLVIVTDASYLYLGQTQMWSVARDTARQMVIGALDDEAEARSYATGRLGIYENNYKVTFREETSFIQVVITVPVAQIVPFGMFTRKFLGEDVMARVIMRKA